MAHNTHGAGKAERDEHHNIDGQVYIHAYVIHRIKLPQHNLAEQIRENETNLFLFFTYDKFDRERKSRWITR